MRHRFTRAALSAAILAPLTLSGASAAGAAADDTHTGHSILWHDGRAATAADDGTFSIGSDVIGPTEVTAMDLDADGRGYATSIATHGLYRIELGAAPVFIDTITHLGATSDCRGFDYTGGTLLASCTRTGGGYMLASIDTATAELTSVASLPAETAAIAHDPLTGDIWLFGHSGGLWIYDGTTVSSALAALPIWGADFDSSGRLWVTRNGVGELLGRTVLLFPAAAGHSETLSVLSRAAVTPPAATPTLAETGTAAATPFAIVAMALLLGAGSVAISVRASRRQRESA